MFDAGYGSSSRFYERAAPKLGMSPSQYRRGGAGMTIRYMVVDSPHDVSAGCSSARPIVASARWRWDRATRRWPTRWRANTRRRRSSADAGALPKWSEAILTHLAGRAAARRSAARRAGDGVSMAGLADAGRHPLRRDAHLRRDRGSHRPAGAARAVARACATNPVALAIPCHRVVPAGGGIGGYRWGPARKKALLDRERAG